MKPIEETDTYTPDGCKIWARNPRGAGVPPMVTVESHNASIAMYSAEIESLRRRIETMRNAISDAIEPESGDYATDKEMREL